ncbi:hypothetical protein M426DRAFT_14647 [Hypoxylon sp. CI-4A]|nr:hypothetical protein M426DRAFT_14647 [Hypoxylon sp. CI-4A]
MASEEAQSGLVPSDQDDQAGDTPRLRLEGVWSEVKKKIGELNDSDHVVLTVLSRGQKRAQEDNYESHNQPQKRRATSSAKKDPPICGNCDRKFHQARDCIKVGRSGWMDGACPKCDEKGHLYDECPKRRSKEDIKYLYWYRQNKGPVKSGINIGKLLETAIQRKHNPRYAPDSISPPPYTPKFARQMQRQRDWRKWLYLHEGHPDREAAFLQYEPQFFKMALGEQAQALNHPGWTRESEDVNLALDGPAPYLSPQQHQQIQMWRRQGQSQDDRLRMQKKVRRLNQASMKEMYTALERGLHCENCGRDKHTEHDCVRRCGACGKTCHRWSECTEKKKMCVCKSRPFHLLEDCDNYCNYCQYMARLENGMESYHKAKDCEKICHRCLGKGHSMLSCAKFPSTDEVPGPCEECGEGMHLATRCLKAMCPMNSCEEPFGCQDHCRDCGWPKALDDMLEKNGRGKHACQWRKVWFHDPAVDYRPRLACKVDGCGFQAFAEKLEKKRAEWTEASIEGKPPESEFECEGCDQRSRDWRELHLK